MKQLRLKERLLHYNGIIVAWSAGSMNCADIVYAGPEFEGEAVDPLYERWITGLRWRCQARWWNEFVKAQSYDWE